MSIDSAYLKFTSLIGDLGKKAVSALYPNDFELYITALELVDSRKDTKVYFLFPVQPYSISEQNRPIQTVKKTAGGVTVMKNATFNPTDTSLQGNFGRKFKFLVGRELIGFSSLLRIPAPTKPKFAQEFDINIKTGYGCCKILESIVNESHKLDDYNQPYSLYLYNLALGQSYLVTATGLDFSQNQENNMIWNYNLSLKSLLPVDQLSTQDPRSLVAKLAARDVLQKSVSELGNFYGSMISNSLR